MTLGIFCNILPSSHFVYHSILVNSYIPFLLLVALTIFIHILQNILQPQKISITSLRPPPHRVVGNSRGEGVSKLQIIGFESTHLIPHPQLTDRQGEGGGGGRDYFSGGCDFMDDHVWFLIPPLEGIVLSPIVLIVFTKD